MAKARDKRGQTPEPWERQPGESTTAFTAFGHYRDMEPHRRSLAEAYRRARGRPEAKYSPGSWNEWHQSNNWLKRAEAWDDEQDRVKREARLDEVKRMGERHAQIAEEVIKKIAGRIKSASKKDLSKVGFHHIPQMLAVAVNIERLARGTYTEATRLEVSDEEPGVDLSKLTDHELEEFEQLVEKASESRADPRRKG